MIFIVNLFFFKQTCEEHSTCFIECPDDTRSISFFTDQTQHTLSIHMQTHTRYPSYAAQNKMFSSHSLSLSHHALGILTP